MPPALPPSRRPLACRTKSGQGSGTIGQLTHGVLTRTLYYEHAALCALVPLLNPSLYPGWDLAALPAGEQ